METPQIDLKIPQKDVWGRIKVVQDRSIFSSLFTFDIPARKWLVYENDVEVRNSASTKATSIDHTGYFRSDGGKVLVASRRHARYQPNRGYYYAGAGAIDHKVRDCAVRWGVFTAENGHYFEYVNGKLYCCRLALGVVEKEEFVELNASVDLTYTFLFDIRVQMRNVGDSEFSISTYLGTAKHMMYALGKRKLFTTPNPQLPSAFEVEKISEDNGIRIGCVDVSSEGGGEPKEEYGSAAFLDITTSNGTLVAAIRQPNTINGYKNTRDVRLTRVTFNCEKKANYELYVTRDPTAVTTDNGDADWTSINSGSFVERVDIANVAGFDTTNAELLTVGSVQAGETNFIDNPSRETIDFFLVHGDIIFIVGYSASGSSTIIIEFGEEV